jgi:hypothetical protein
MHPIRSLFSLLAVAACVSLATPTSANAQLDSEGALELQTFLSPNSASILTEFFFDNFAYTGTLVFDLRRFARISPTGPFGPVGPSLYSFVEPTGTFPPAAFTLFPNVMVEASTTYALVFELPEGGGLFKINDPSFSFPDGSFWVNTFDPWLNLPNDDLPHFSVSFEPVVATPEPTSFVLVATGFAAIIGVRSWRRRT